MNYTITGLITKVISGFYYVETADNIYERKARGSVIKSQEEPVPGDRVQISVISGDKATLERITPRKNCLVRPALANVDQLFIVVSTCEPSPNHIIIDKMIAIAEYSEIEPVLIITKTDIKKDKNIAEIYEKAGFKCFIVSPEEQGSINDIKVLMNDKISAFTGNSGAGKSTVLNMMYPEFKRETGKISQKLGRGRHTTRHVELFKISDNGYVADTPGFSTMDIVRYQLVDKEQLQYCFREFGDYIGSCKFTSCSHTKEKGCAITRAVEDKKIPEIRHKSYVAMYDEIKDIKKWELNIK